MILLRRIVICATLGFCFALQSPKTYHFESEAPRNFTETSTPAATTHEIPTSTGHYRKLPFLSSTQCPHVVDDLEEKETSFKYPELLLNNSKDLTTKDVWTEGLFSPTTKLLVKELLAQAFPDEKPELFDSAFDFAESILPYLV
ncbi:uncharacterized protein LY89DRAFT_713273 [Mollisia scopiformis]|uniref:Uncharacterized protein n=1 Tax=Mollisia scopiformis TaxID=149040 RepID=A0A194XWL5_MOLSC|nr:uncharacterized protein LY89DRAFT_713273 [Mollisia scopiformis]KUJ24414.1 hypothetical protein LY89DRAFT_713273 [Mollisia scopiformis]